MAKAREEAPPSEKLKQDGDKKPSKSKERDALVGRVKKVVKKSRRKLSEQKFERELQRTITFLEQLRARIAEPQDGQPVALTQPDELSDEAAPSAMQRAGKKNKKSKKKKAAQAVTAAPAQTEAPPPGD